MLKVKIKQTPVSVRSNSRDELVSCMHSSLEVYTWFNQVKLAFKATTHRLLSMFNLNFQAYV